MTTVLSSTIALLVCYTFDVLQANTKFNRSCYSIAGLSDYAEIVEEDNDYSTPGSECCLFTQALYFMIISMARFMFNPLDARRRYTDFPQVSQRRQTAVYRPNGFLQTPLADGIPSIRFVDHSRRPTVYNLCFLMHTGPSIPES